MGARGESDFGPIVHIPVLVSRRFGWADVHSESEGGLLHWGVNGDLALGLRTLSTFRTAAQQQSVLAGCRADVVTAVSAQTLAEPHLLSSAAQMSAQPNRGEWDKQRAQKPIRRADDETCSAVGRRPEPIGLNREAEPHPGQQVHGLLVARMPKRVFPIRFAMDEEYRLGHAGRRESPVKYARSGSGQDACLTDHDSTAAGINA